MGKLDKWLDDLPPDGKRWKVRPELIEPIKKWMRSKPLDGGVSFNEDFTEIYKFEIPNENVKINTRTD